MRGTQDRDAQRALDTLEETISRLEDEVSGLRDQLASSESEVASCKDTVSDLECQLEELEGNGLKRASALVNNVCPHCSKPILVEE